MTQAQLNREVARATGETVDFIKQMGFVAVVVPAPCAHARRHRHRRGRYQRLPRHVPGQRGAFPAQRI